MVILLIVLSGGARSFGQEAVPESPVDEAPAAAEEPESEVEVTEAAQPESEPEPEPEGEPVADTAESERSAWYSGEIRAEVDAEWSDDGSDLDLDQSFRLDLDPPEHPRFHLRSSFWFHEDVGGDDDGIHSDLYDAWDSDVQARVVYLHLDVDDLWGDSTLRLGRQRIMENGYYNRLDGAYFQKRMPRWNWYAFAGWRASFYEDGGSDPAYGGGVSVNATPTTRLALDAYQVEEHRRKRIVYHRRRFTDFLNKDFPRDVEREFVDSSVTLSLWQEIAQQVQLYAAYRWDKGDGDELRVELSGYVTSWDLSYVVGYKKRFDTERDQPNDLTAYYRVLGSFEASDSWFVSLYKPLFDVMTVSLEAELRDVDHGDWRTNNRDFGRYAIGLHFEDFFWEMDADIGAEKWDVAGGEEGWSINAELARAFGPLEVSVGAGYENYIDESLYYDFFPNWQNQLRIAASRNNSNLLRRNFTVNLRDVKQREDHIDIYSIFTDVRWTITERQEFNAGVTFEQDDFSESPYWRVRAGYTLKF